jgi:hypothetical protein
MIKRDKNFKLSKQVKRWLAVMPESQRSKFKNTMIEAQILGSIVPKVSKKKDKETEVES